MHAAIGSQTHEMDALTLLLGIAIGTLDFRILKDAAILAGTVNLDKVLIDDATGTDVQVTYFAVAHLSVRQTYVFAAGIQLRMWADCVQIVKIRCGRAEDNVATSLVADSPSVENHKNCFLCHKMSFKVFMFLSFSVLLWGNYKNCKL